MLMVVFAAVCSLLALFSGIAAVGSGRHWQFTPKDILRGKRNALLYVWVTASTIFSLARVTATIGYALNPSLGLGPTVQLWFGIYAGVALLITAAHAFIYWSLEARKGSEDECVWGFDRVR